MLRYQWWVLANAVVVSVVAALLPCLQGQELECAPMTLTRNAHSLLLLSRPRCTRPAIFMGTECVIEKVRGKTDIMNPVYAGCVTGATFGIKQGPQAACIGCAGMAAFTVVIEKIMGH